MFSKGASSGRRVLFLVAASLLLLAIDSFTPWLKPARKWVAEATVPLYWITNIPARLSEFGDESVVSRQQLEEENEQLRTELLILKGRMQRTTEVVAENVRLRNLLNATEMLKDQVLVAELIGVSPDPTRHTILINRGEENGVYVGQALLDADGLMGQVVEVHRSSSKVLLVTDTAHALPVQTLRNGARSIAEGSGDYNQLSLRYVPPTMDIVVGDRLVSSGLGGRFPVGYPVGVVTEVQTVVGEPYLSVKLKPSARIDRSRHLLLLFSEVETLGDGEIGRD
ncbi:rod shape-determining protein MreC [Porticoccus litoralis]|uniref:Cell shape-determining protein MreC n=1 Tax=Porticoccus litoralis TaxID=434086 RepID=A0AAW8B465_9GAMM|nr:rod shape-determining protein MreC [Porticoccus litoralis]MDP1520265.1 rod shape-determining protein MreC [Porticoccus litoralis]